MTRKKPFTIKHKLRVTIEAQTLATVAHMVDALARAACDIANSQTDEEAHISVRDSRR